MSNWNSMQIGNQCNSLRNNAVHHRFGFHLSLYSTGNFYVRYFLFDIETVASTHVLLIRIYNFGFHLNA